MRILLAIVIALSACGGDDGPAADATPAPVCTGQPYDSCTDNTQCMSNNCKTFGGAGLQICTQTCTPGSNECPMQDGQQVPCNNMGFCRPAVANACTAP